MSLAEIRESLHVGAEYDVTNHFITRPDHYAFGTTRRTVTAVNASAFRLDGSRVEWPKAAQVTLSDGGVITLRGGGCGQASDALFLTLVPVPR